MRLKFLVIVFIALITLPVIAQESIPVMGTIKNPSEMPSGVYKLDSSHAHAIFFINHLGFSEYTGDFHDISGTLNYAPAALETSKLNVTIKASSVVVQSKKLNEELKGPNFFNTAKYPDITFTSTELKKTSERTGTLIGNLTFLGATRPLTLDVEFMGGGTNPMSKAQTMGFVATGTLRRSDFGMVNYLPGLGNDIRLHISAEFAQDAPQP